MSKNASKPIMLLAAFSFLVAAYNEDVPNDSSTEATEKVQKDDRKTRLRQKIATFAKKYEKTKYKYGGTTPKGFDCSGFTFFVMNEFGIKLPHNSAQQSKKGHKTAIKKVQTGDLLFFSNKKGINHVGLVLSNKKEELKMIHCSSKRGIVIDEVYSNSYWNPRLKSARNVID